MNVKEIHEDLNFGELSQVSLGGDRASGIRPDDFIHIASHIERTLSILHRRFRLREGRIQIELEEGKMAYPVVDAEVPVMRIEHVLWPDGFGADVRAPNGLIKYLPLNDEGVEFSVFTPQTTVIRVPDKLWQAGVRELDVIYRAGHKKLDKSLILDSPELVDIDLPEAFREPLMLNIAAQIMNPIGTVAEGFHEGNNYAAKFENACKYLEEYGWEVSTVFERSTFNRSGFV